MPATVKLTRTIVGIGRIELRRGTFDVLIDGNGAGSIEWHETIEISVPSGTHTLLVRKGRYSSRGRTFDAADGELVTFRCHGANLWPTWLLSFAVPNLALSLSRE